MNQEKSKYDIIEKITFSFGVVVLITLFGYLGFQIVQKDGKPPQLYTTVKHIPEMKDYSFKVEVENKGDQTAETAIVKLDLYQNGKIAESGSIELKYVPVKSKETAWIVFSKTKKTGDSLVVSSISFIQP